MSTESSTAPPSRPIVSGRRGTKRLLALILGLLAGLVAAEGTARVWRATRPRPGDTFIRTRGLWVHLYPENLRGTFLDIRSRPDLFAPEADIVKKAVKDGHVYAVRYRVNRLGLREAELRRPPPGIAPIAFLGDSFTYGVGVREADIYPRVFERLVRRSEESEIRVMNLARFGFDIEDAAQALEHLALPLGAKDIYYGFVLNDPICSPEFEESCPSPDVPINFAPTADAGPLALVSLVRRTLHRRRLTVRTIDWYHRMYTDENADFERTWDMLRDMRRLSSEHGATFRLVILPIFYSLREDYPFRDIHRLITEFCDREGIPCLDLLPFYAGKRATDFWITSWDGHPNDIGHRIAAQAIADWRRTAGGKRGPGRR